MFCETMSDKIYFIVIVGVLCYLSHTILGDILWDSYNPITMDISTLTSNTCPFYFPFRILTFVYGVIMIIFSILLFLNYYPISTTLKTACSLYIIMNSASFIGYSFFPIDKEASSSSFGNVMHLVTTFIVVFTSIGFSFTFSIGYRKVHLPQAKILLVFAILISIFGVSNPIVISNNFPFMGVTERLVIYTILAQAIYIAYCAYYFHHQLSLSQQKGQTIEELNTNRTKQV
eukprot:gnl/Carplike_NY0171/4863_a6631_291.p1 GENE.gnl/Carplike_NY0171/4863_a6631_291~~gnl/Carplike_NY0171/4863_a6631_291.p1  ORF type:complete len:231 (-),score=1.85 gnl/Carplike_NY0171/4863_a6631_291:89-781(-)